jgi:hypothetical protein
MTEDKRFATSKSPTEERKSAFLNASRPNSRPSLVLPNNDISGATSPRTNTPTSSVDLRKSDGLQNNNLNNNQQGFGSGVIKPSSPRTDLGVPLGSVRGSSPNKPRTNLPIVL